MDYERGYIVERQIADGSVDYWAGMYRRWSPDIREARILDIESAQGLAGLCQITLNRMASIQESNYATFHAKRIWRPMQQRAQTRVDLPWSKNTHAS